MSRKLRRMARSGSSDAKIRRRQIGVHAPGALDERGVTVERVAARGEHGADRPASGDFFAGVRHVADPWGQTGVRPLEQSRWSDPGLPGLTPNDIVPRKDDGLAEGRDAASCRAELEVAG